MICIINIEIKRDGGDDKKKIKLKKIQMVGMI